MSTSYRGAPDVLPLPGGRIHVLGAAGSGPMLGTMAIWMGTLLALVPLSILAEGRVPEEVLPFIAIPVVLTGLTLAIVYHLRAVRGGRYRLHHEGQRMILEQRSPHQIVDLDDAQLFDGRHEYRVRATRAALPTVTITAAGFGPLIVTGPIGVGWENLGEREVLASLDDERPASASRATASRATASRATASRATGAPQLRLDDAAAFAALQSKARRG